MLADGGQFSGWRRFGNSGLAVCCLPRRLWDTASFRMPYDTLSHGSMMPSVSYDTLSHGSMMLAVSYDTLSHGSMMLAVSYDTLSHDSMIQPCIMIPCLKAA